MRLPAADDLFRPTTGPTANDAPESAREPAEAERGAGRADAGPSAGADVPEAPDTSKAAASGDQGGSGRRKPSGRVRHDEKMTIYVTADELLDIEHARLMMRRNHGLAVDRGRLVREAMAIALADFEANGDDSLLVQRLTQT